MCFFIKPFSSCYWIVFWIIIDIKTILIIFIFFIFMITEFLNLFVVSASLDQQNIFSISCNCMKEEILHFLYLDIILIETSLVMIEEIDN